MNTARPNNTANIVKAGIYFLLSTIITWWFIIQCPLYFSKQQQLLSCSIAGAKWAIQLGAAWLFLSGKKWLFIRKTGFTCLVGSLLLLPYCIVSFLQVDDSASFFFSSLGVAVLALIASYYANVVSLKIDLKWWFGWLVCLVIAISLQLTVVFQVIHL